MPRRILDIPRKLLSREDGAVLVEFALVLPVMLLFFAVTIEAGRMLWTYQQVVSGVRDASRYLGRAAPYEICPGFSGPTEPLATRVSDIVRDDIGGVSIFGTGVTVNSVTYSVSCTDDSGESGAADDYADAKVMIGTVSAQVTVDFPLGNVFSLFGEGLASLNTTVIDRMRIYGQ
jgi:hypothetical protein